MPKTQLKLIRFWCVRHLCFPGKGAQAQRLFWEDRPMWLKMTSYGIKFHFINADITKYRRHSESIQVNSKGTLFSRTLLSKDEGSRVVILPHLPFYERLLNLYVFSVRKCFFKMFKNRKTIFINIPYKILVIFAEKWLIKIKRQFAPWLIRIAKCIW